MAIDGYFTSYIDTELTERWSADTLSVLLTKPEYSPDLAGHSTRADVPSAAIIAEAILQNVTVTNGLLICDSVTFTGVATSSTQIMSMVVTNTVTGKLVAALQTVTGLQIAPNGNDIRLNIDPDQGLLAI